MNKQKLTRTEDLLLESYYTGILSASLMSIFIAALLVYVLWPYVGHTTLLLWGSAIILGNGFRVYNSLLFTKKKELHSFHFWEKRYIYPALLAGFIWGSILFFIINKVPLALEPFISCFFLGVIVAVVIVNISHKVVSLTYSFSILIPYFIRTLFEDFEFKFLFGLSLILLMILIYRLIDATTKATRKNLKLIEEKEKLVEQLQNQYELEKELNDGKIKSLQNSKLISLGEITGGIAHEINNPLTIIIGKLLLLKKKAQANQASEQLLVDIASIHQVALRIGSIVQVMRDLSRKDENATLEELSVLSLVKSSLTNLEAKILEQSVEINFDELEDFKVMGIQEHIIQVMINIISNAIDAIGDFPESWIKIKSIKNGQKIQILFMDSGDGISEELLDKLFEPFFTTKEIGKGSGLGLSISKSLMNRIEGDLYYQKNKGHTCFVIELTAA